MEAWHANTLRTRADERFANGTAKRWLNRDVECLDSEGAAQKHEQVQVWRQEPVRIHMPRASSHYRLVTSLRRRASHAFFYLACLRRRYVGHIQRHRRHLCCKKTSLSLLFFRSQSTTKHQELLPTSPSSSIAQIASTSPGLGHIFVAPAHVSPKLSVQSTSSLCVKANCSTHPTVPPLTNSSFDPSQPHATRGKRQHAFPDLDERRGAAVSISLGTFCYLRTPLRALPFDPSTDKVDSISHPTHSRRTRSRRTSRIPTAPSQLSSPTRPTTVSPPPSCPT